MYKTSDWQISHIKKDLSYVRKNLSSQRRFNFVAISTMTITVLGVLLSCDWEKHKIVNWILVSLSIAVFLICFSIEVLSPILKRINKTRKEAIDVEKYIAIFDDELSTYVLSAVSMQKEIDGACGAEKKYYISETSYYINKSISILTQFDRLGDKGFAKIFSIKIGEGKISYRRAKMVCDLLKEIRGKLDTAIGESSEYSDIREENRLYDEQLLNFLQGLDNWKKHTA